MKTVQWEEIRTLVEQGVDYHTLAERYDTTYQAIAVKCSNEKWLTPRRVKAALKTQAALQAEKLKTDHENGQIGTLSPPVGQKEAVLFESWQKRAEDLRNLSFDTAVEAIKRSRGLITIESASDLKAAVHVARQATGLLDAEAPAVSLNLFGGGSFQLQEDEAPTIDLPPALDSLDI